MCAVVEKTIDFLQMEFFHKGEDKEVSYLRI